MTDEPTTDEPTTDKPDQPTEPTEPTEPTAPDQPSGVGFAAIQTPGQPAPQGAPPPGFQGPPPGFQGAPPPGPPVYQGPPPGYGGPPTGPVGYQGPPPGYGGPPPGPPVYQGPPPGYGGPPPGPPGYPPTPSPGYQGGPPPGYGGPPRYYAPPPPAPSGGPSLVLVGGLALVLVLVLGVGAMFALDIGPFAKPTPTAIARPTEPPATATPRTTPSPSAAPGASARPTPTPTNDATAAPSGDISAQLISHIPTDFADTCFTSTGTAPILALATCTADNGKIQLTYFQYDSQDAMFLAYEGFRFASQIEPDSGDCEDPASWPAENNYNVGGQPAGRWLCTEALGQTSIYWTDDRLNILSQATHTTADHARLVDFWVGESGPNL